MKKGKSIIHNCKGVGSKSQWGSLSRPCEAARQQQPDILRDDCSECCCPRWRLLKSLIRRVRSSRQWWGDGSGLLRSTQNDESGCNVSVLSTPWRTPWSPTKPASHRWVLEHSSIALLYTATLFVKVGQPSERMTNDKACSSSRSISQSASLQSSSSSCCPTCRSYLLNVCDNEWATVNSATQQIGVAKKIEVRVIFIIGQIQLVTS